MSLVLPFSLAFLISLVLNPITMIIANKFGFIDDPKKHKHPAILHRKIVPRAGGVPVYLAFAICALLLVGFSKPLLGIILGGLVLISVGIIDDKLDIGYFWKLLAQIAAASVVVLAGVGITFITNPLHILGLSNFGSTEIIRLDSLRIAFDFFGTHTILVLADLFALFWIVWVINMVNFSSGVDGQMPGIVLVTLFVLLLASFRFVGDPSQLVATKLTVIGMGATLGFLIFNFYPAKIFPGDSGPYFLGFLIAVLAILSGAKVGTAILVMAVPLIDGVFTVIRRVASGKSPFMGDKKHLHHRLLELGWGQRRIALFYWALCAILGAAALSLNSAGKIFVGVVMVIFILGGLIWLDMNLPQKAQR